MEEAHTNSSDSELTRSVQDGDWTTVVRLLQEHAPHSDEERNQTIEKFITSAPEVYWLMENQFSQFANLCGSEQLERLLERAVAEQWWAVVGSVLEKGVSTRKRIWAVREASKNAVGRDFEVFILPHCRKREMFGVLKRLVTRQLWQCVDKALMSEVGNLLCWKHQRWVFTKASKKINLEDFEKCILPYCGEELLIDTILPRLEKRGLLPSKQPDSNVKGETKLHFIFKRSKIDREELVYFIAKASDPLTVTKDGRSVLVYAVEHEESCVAKVDECIRQGFSTHQPPLTGQLSADDVMKGIVCKVMDSLDMYFCLFGDESLPFPPTSHLTSPFVLAVIEATPLVAPKLYESGACSYKELFLVYTVIKDVMNPLTERGTEMQRTVSSLSRQARQRWPEVEEHVKAFLPCLKEMATTPRSLMSTSPDDLTLPQDPRKTSERRAAAPSHGQTEGLRHVL